MKNLSDNIMSCSLFSGRKERDLFVSGVMLYPDGSDDKIYRYVLHAAMWHLGSKCAGDGELRDTALNCAGSGNSEIYLQMVRSVGGWHKVWEYLSNRQQKNPSIEIDTRISNAMCAASVFMYAIDNGVSRHESVRVHCENNQERVDGLCKLYSCPGHSKLNEDNINSNIWNNFKNSVHMWAALTHFYQFNQADMDKYIDFDMLVPIFGDTVGDPFRMFLEIA